jgi:hypothetical protein
MHRATRPDVRPQARLRALSSGSSSQQRYCMHPGETQMYILSGEVESGRWGVSTDHSMQRKHV